MKVFSERNIFILATVVAVLFFVAKPFMRSAPPSQTCTVEYKYMEKGVMKANTDCGEIVFERADLYNAIKENLCYQFQYEYVREGLKQTEQTRMCGVVEIKGDTPEPQPQTKSIAPATYYVQPEYNLVTPDTAPTIINNTVKDGGELIINIR